MLKTTDIFGAISIINKLDIMPQIKNIQSKNIDLNFKKSKIMDKVVMAKFSEINALEDELKTQGKTDNEIKQLMSDKVVSLLKEHYPEDYEEAEEINIQLSSWKFDLLNLILENVGKAEEDLYNWISKYTGKDKQIYMDNPSEFMDALIGVADDPNLSSLFNLMKKSFKI